MSKLESTMHLLVVYFFSLDLPPANPVVQQEFESKQCVAKVCKSGRDICQLRLDFLNFVLQGKLEA